MAAETVDFEDDPRLHDEHIRHLPGDVGGNGDVTLAGVLHDHPASRFRARELVAAREPAVLAVEVAPLALPLFEQYAVDGRDLPAFGGEVSAAIAAADGARVVGIDGVDGRFLRIAVRAVREERPAAATLSAFARSVGDAVGSAAVCRLAAAVSAATGVRVEADDPVEHQASLSDEPATQAADERAQLSKSLALLRCAEPPEPVRLRDEVREACMARRLADLRAEGDVVAVVGRGHLEPLAERLS